MSPDRDYPGFHCRARVLPLNEIGILELLVLCGYLMTFFWSDAFIKGFLAKKGELEIQLYISALLFLLGLIPCHFSLLQDMY
jgi:hypothetical protein